MIRDNFAIWITVFFMMALTGGMMLNGLSSWWIPITIAFIVIGFHIDSLETEADTKDLEEVIGTFQDLKARYEAPDEYNTPDMITQKDINETIEATLKENDR